MEDKKMPDVMAWFSTTEEGKTKISIKFSDAVGNALIKPNDFYITLFENDNQNNDKSPNYTGNLIHKATYESKKGL